MAIIINQPYIEKIEGNKVRLCSKIEGDLNDVLYYEVEDKYEQYLCDDRADAFLVGLLHHAMYEKQNICCECGVSEQLLFQLRTYFIPIVSQNMKDLHNVSISAEPLATLQADGTAVGTGLSGGVDSFYTVTRYNDSNLGSFKLTHLLFNNIFTADDDEQRIRTQHLKDVEEKRRIAEEIGLEYVDMYTNLYAFYRHPGIFNHYFTLQYASAVMALGKLFRIFYFSSSYVISQFSIDYDHVPSGAPFDLFTLKCVTTSDIAFYSAGCEVTRFQKMEYFAHNTVVQKHLQVCGANQDYGGHTPMQTLNCGSCMKCSRAIVSTILLGVFDEYAPAFDLNRFKKGKNRFIGRELAGDKGLFSKELLERLKKQKYMNLAVYIWRFLYSIKFRLSKVKLLRDIITTVKNKRV